jgi:hypothetical protein
MTDRDQAVHSQIGVFDLRRAVFGQSLQQWQKRASLAAGTVNEQRRAASDSYQ